MNKAAALLTWTYAAMFGLPTIPVAWFLDANGFLPTFQGQFEMYGGPWSGGLQDDTFIKLLFAFFLVTLVAAFLAWLLWRGSKVGVVLSLAWIPVEAVFWYGFALPFPVLFGAVRIALIILAWRSLNRRSPSEALFTLA